MPDPVQNGFGHGQLWPLWPVCRQNQAGSYMPDPTSHFCFCKEDPDHVVQNWSGSDLDDLVMFWANTSGPEVNRCARIIGPRFWQNTTGPLPVSHFQTCLLSLTDGLEHIVQNCLDPIWFWLTVMFFAKRILSGGKPVCKNHRACFWDQIQHVYWVNPADLIQGEFLLKAR